MRMLEGDGVETGVDLDALIGISEWLGTVFGRSLEGKLSEPGTFRLAVVLDRPDAVVTVEHASVLPAPPFTTSRRPSDELTKSRPGASEQPVRARMG